jgi:hypothetical protein
MSMLTLPARIGRRIAHHRAIAELHREFAEVVSRGAARRRGGGKRIGLASFGHGEWHLAYELLIAHALERRGAAPELLVCDLPELPLCSDRLVNSTSQQRCGGCVDVKRGLLDAGGMPWRGLSEFVANAALDRARGIADAIDPRDIDGYRERNYPIGEWLHVSACHFLRCDARGDAPEKVATRRRLLATAIVGIEAVERWLTEAAPDVVLVQGGAHTLPRIARELARARRIPVISRELGKGGWDRQIFALDHDCMAPDLDEAWSAARGQPLTPQEDAEVDALSARLCADTYLPPRNGHTAADLPIDPGKKIAVAFTNVTWDLATADRDVAFTGILDWLTETMTVLAAHPGVQLVIRAHPAEASVMTRERIAERIAAEWPRSPGVVVIAPEHPVAARDLFARADLVLAYNSTAGLEAAMHGKRVMLCGAPHFRGRGFTVDVADRDQYRDLLRSWAKHGDGGDADCVSALARRYFHLFFARYHIPVGWTTSPLEPPYRLRITSLDELDPGRNSAVDLICDGILNGRQILRPRAGEEAACLQ